MTIFILGGILGHLRFGLSDNFHWGGGVFWDTSDLDSLTIFILGGILGHLGFGLSDNFHFGGRGRGGILQNRGILWDLDQNFNHSSRLMHHR